MYASHSRPCVWCRRNAVFSCSRCFSAFYCDTQCQLKHWTLGNHAKSCSKEDMGRKTSEDAIRIMGKPNNNKKEKKETKVKSGGVEKKKKVQAGDDKKTKKKRDDGKASKDQEKHAKEVESHVCVGIMGMVFGEKAVAVRDRLKDCKFELGKVTLPPSLSFSWAFESPLFEESVYPKMVALSRFQGLSKEDVKKWYETNAIKYMYLSEITGASATFSNSQKGISDKLSDEKTLERLKNGEEIDFVTLAKAFPAKSQSAEKQFKHNRTLAFQVEAWAIEPDAAKASASSTEMKFWIRSEVSNSNTRGAIWKSTGAEGYRKLTNSRPNDFSMFRVGTDLTVIHKRTEEESGTALNMDAAKKMLSSGRIDLGNPTAAEIEKIFWFLGEMTLGGLKSMLQKIVRFSPSRVSLDLWSKDGGQGETVDARSILAATCCFMIMTKGSFNPDSGTYETGVHAFCKRLAVIIVEDAWFDSAEEVVLDLLITCSFSTSVSGKSSWNPSVSTIERWVRYALTALSSDTCLKFDQNETSVPFEEKARDAAFGAEGRDRKPLVVASYLMDRIIMGMKGDLLMFRDVAKRVRVSEKSGREVQKGIMPGYHYVDQHCATDAAYLLDAGTEASESISTSGKTPFGKLFRRWFDDVTGYNPRRTKRAHDVSSPFSLAVKKAQLYYARCNLASGGTSQETREDVSTGDKSRGEESSFVEEDVGGEKETITISDDDEREDAVMKEEEVDTVSDDDDDLGVTRRRGVAEIPNTRNGKTWTWKAPEGWIACCVGNMVFEAKNKKKYQITLRPDDVTEMAVTSIRGRDVDDQTPVDDETRSEIMTLAKDKLVLGFEIDMKAKRVFFSPPANAKNLWISAVLDKVTNEISNYRFKWNPFDPWMDWDEFSTIVVTVPNLVNSIPLSHATEVAFSIASSPSETAKNPKGPGSRFSHPEVPSSRCVNDLFDDVLWGKAYSPSSMGTFIEKLKGGGNLELPKPGRDGGAGGVDIPQKMDFDISVLCRWMCAHFPEALSPQRGSLRNFVTSRDGEGLRRWVAESLERAYRKKIEASFSTADPRFVMSKDSRRTDFVKKGISEEATTEESVQWVQDYLESYCDVNLLPHQVECLQWMVDRKATGRTRGNFVWMPVGSGKTLIAGAYILYLSAMGRLPPKILFSTPASAMETVLDSLKNKMKFPVSVHGSDSSSSSSSSSSLVVEGSITLMEHDQLRKYVDKICDMAHEILFVVDEVHKTTNLQTQRSGAALRIASLSREVVMLTGTPLNNNDSQGLKRWLAFCVEFPVNEQTFMVAANSMIVRKSELAVNKIERDFLIENAETKEIALLMPQRMGGSLPAYATPNFKLLYEMSRNAAENWMIEKTVELLAEEGADNGVFIVVEKEERGRIVQKKLTDVGLKSFLITGKTPLNLTPESVGSGKVYDWKVVIAPMAQNAGYNLTTLNWMLTGVYPSNLAKRQQIRGRLHRMGQKRDVNIITAHCGLTTFIHKHHTEAKNLESLLAQLAVIKQ